MQNNISNISFTGSYLINYKNTPKTVRECFEKAIGKNKRQIFDSFEGKKDQVLYVMKNSKDYDAAQVVKKHYLNFKYMPKLNTKLRFDTDKPEEVINYIKENKLLKITKFDELNKYINNYRIRCRAKYKDTPPRKDLADSIMDALKINLNGVKTRDAKGITTIKDKANNGLVVMSPKGKLGVTYVFYKPANKYESESRYAVSETGEILAKYSTPDGIKKFKENFAKTLK